MWDWVGGCYLLWLVIGLLIVMFIGIFNFKELLFGVYNMDQYFQIVLFECNILVLFGLFGVWYGDFWGVNSYVILFYDYYLWNIIDYL